MISKVHNHIKPFQVCVIIVELPKCTVDNRPSAMNRYSADQEIASVKGIEDSSLLSENTDYADTYTTYSPRYQFYYYPSTWS
jgi:hypothetical protein